LTQIEENNDRLVTELYNNNQMLADTMKQLHEAQKLIAEYQLREKKE